MTVHEFTSSLAAKVESGLRSVLESRRMPLYGMMSYHMGWTDRGGNPEPPRDASRTHGVVCLAACAACGGDVEKAVPAAAAVELVENFSQIHDDVQGGRPQRDGRDAVWWAWGPAQAINAGDGMHALARLAMFQLRTEHTPPETTYRAVRLLDEASLELCEGRFEDLEAQERIDLSVEAYMKTASKKTGALYECAMKLGALLASREEREAESLGRCGRNAGIALQIRRDMLELWPASGGDSGPSATVLNKTKLLPVVYAVQEANINDKRRLGDVYFKRVLEAGDVEVVRETVERLGGRQYCEDRVEEYTAKAEQEAADAGLSDDGMETVRQALIFLLGSADAT
jgi:geranylgeranyl diphosphate synthase type I